MSHMMRSRKLMLMGVHPLVVARLILHRWADTALVAVTIVFLPFGHESLLGIREHSVRRAEPLLRGDRATSCRGCDHVSILADADRHVAHVHGDLPSFRVSQRLGQGPDVVVGETEGLDFRELGVLRKRGQRHPQAFQRVVQSVHPVPLAIVRLYSTIPFQSEHLRANQWFRDVNQFASFLPLSSFCSFRAARTPGRMLSLGGRDLWEIGGTLTCVGLLHRVFRVFFRFSSFAGGNRASVCASCLGDSKLTSKPESEELDSSSKPPSLQNEYSEDMLRLSISERDKYFTGLLFYEVNGLTRDWLKNSIHESPIDVHSNNSFHRFHR